MLWPQYGGPRRDFSAADAIRDAWAGSAPKQIWRRDLGPGFAGMVVGGGRLVASYRDGEDDIIAAFDRRNGHTLWTYRHPAPVTASHGLDTSYGEGPNSTPLLTERGVTALSFSGIVTQLDAATGRRMWSHDLSAEYGQRIPYFGNASSPIRHGDTVIVVAGDIYAFDLAVGDLIWRQGGVSGSYASPLLVPRDDKMMLLLAGAGEVVGIDPATGAISWRHEHANQHRTILSSPVLGPDSLVFVSAYYIGSIGLELSSSGDSVRQVWRLPQMQISHSNAVRTGDLILGFHNSILTAVDIRSGEIVWRHRGLRRGNLLLAGDRLLHLGHLGKLSLLSAGPEGVEVESEAQLVAERSWTAPVLIGRMLYVRTEETLAAYDLGHAAPASGLRAGGDGGYAPPAPSPDGFQDAFMALQAAVYAGDMRALEEAGERFAAWTEGPWGPVALYCQAVALWQRMDGTDAADQLSLLDAAIATLDRAVEMRRDYADAHALLARLYPGYYRLDGQRGAVIGPLSEEHLSLAEVHAPDNPRVLAARGMSLFHRGAEHGGDQVLGLEKLRQALVRFAQLDEQEADVAIGPMTWGEALVWNWYGQALLQLPQPDLVAARRAFEKAVALQPGFTEAREHLRRLTEGADSDDPAS